ncbi:MAG: zinc-ribbon domain-containing protein [Gemmatimonadota bacterium]|nr:MAG: zinc-ribbon domain-containing protein [Gemmatimonadota bacterium]
MNVRCPSCETLYRVDPAKVPNEGVRASCVTCGVVFLVSQRTSDEQIRRPPEAESPGRVAAVETPDTPPAAAAAWAPEPPPEQHAPPEIPQVPKPVFEIGAAASQSEASEGETQRGAEVPAKGGAVVGPTDLTDYPEPPGTGYPTDEPRPRVEPQQPAGPRFELSTARQEPAVEPEPAKEPNEPPQQRFSRPFVAPSTDSLADQRRAPSGPMRPSAPVFRPTPGMPVRTPPIPETPRRVATPVPRAEREAAPPRPGGPEAAQTGRPLNPFLSRDPKQKARRLARALVSDMIVYQPKKRQDALEAGTLKDVFEEEIKKSWEEYVQQVGEELANTTGYFTEALNDILAGGRQIF